MLHMFSNIVSLYSFGLFVAFYWAPQAIHFCTPADEFLTRHQTGLTFKFSDSAALILIILWKFRVKITRVVEIQSLSSYRSTVWILQHKLSVSLNKCVQQSMYLASRWSY